MSHTDPMAAHETTVPNAMTEVPAHTITRLHLAEAVYRSVGLSRRESAQLVEGFLDTLCEVLVAGEAVKISSFGSFLVRSKAERIGRNPKTGVEVPITQRRVLVFKPSNVLKAAMKPKHSKGDGAA